MAGNSVGREPAGSPVDRGPAPAGAVNGAARGITALVVAGTNRIPSCQVRPQPPRSKVFEPGSRSISRYATGVRVQTSVLPSLSRRAQAATVSRNGMQLVRSVDQREVDAGAMQCSEPKPTETPESGVLAHGHLLFLRSWTGAPDHLGRQSDTVTSVSPGSLADASNTAGGCRARCRKRSPQARGGSNLHKPASAMG